MLPKQEQDLEAVDSNEQDALLPSPKISARNTGFHKLHLTAAFFAGLLTCFVAQYSLCGFRCFNTTTGESSAPADAHILAPPYVGSSEINAFPPTSPTNAYPSLFPTNVGYAGGTPTGAEPAIIATAPYYPMHTGAAQLVIPKKLGQKDYPDHTKFDLLKHWGNLSPWYSVGKGTFGLDSEPEAPEGCSITGLHLLHRHGARYPTPYSMFYFKFYRPFVNRYITVKIPMAALPTLLHASIQLQANGMRLAISVF